MAGHGDYKVHDRSHQQHLQHPSACASPGDLCRSGVRSCGLALTSRSSNCLRTSFQKGTPAGQGQRPQRPSALELMQRCSVGCVPFSGGSSFLPYMARACACRVSHPARATGRAEQAADDTAPGMPCPALGAPAAPAVLTAPPCYPAQSGPAPAAQGLLGSHESWQGFSLWASLV